MIEILQRISLHFTQCIYLYLICLYPREYRERFEKELRQLIRTTLSQRPDSKSQDVLALLWMHWLPDLFVCGLREQYKRLELGMKGPRLIWTLAVMVCVLPFFAFYLSAGYASLMPYLHGALPQAGQYPTNLILALPYFPYFFAAQSIFSNVSAYILVTVVGLVLIMAGLIRKTFSKSTKGFLGLAALAIVAFPFTLHYEPALTAKAGYRTIVITQPNFIGNVVKVAQMTSEQRPCKYEISGWQNTSLYYTAACGTTTAIFQYNSQQGVTQQVQGLPVSFSSTTLPKNQVLEIVSASGVSPQEIEAVTRSIVLASEGFVSADGKWVAFVSQHVYGPQDIVVISQSE